MVLLESADQWMKEQDEEKGSKMRRNILTILEKVIDSCIRL